MALDAAAADQQGGPLRVVDQIQGPRLVAQFGYVDSVKGSDLIKERGRVPAELAERFEKILFQSPLSSLLASAVLSTIDDESINCLPRMGISDVLRSYSPWLQELVAFCSKLKY